MGGDDGSGTPDGGVRPDRADGGAQKSACDKMDILFVIDNSGSMQLEQANLATNFPSFISLLDGFKNSDGNPIDYQVGVTTTGVTKNYQIDSGFGFTLPSSQTGDDGNLVEGATCMMPRRYLERADTAVSDKFSCVANVGTDGPSDEMPLEGMRLALTSRVSDGSNAGFLRPDALLAVVLLTDEDDCSRTDDGFTVGLSGSMCDQTEPVTTYLAALDAAKGGRNLWAGAIIAGIGPGPCTSALGDAVEATRLLDFASKAGPNVLTSSICEGDFAGALGKAMAKFQDACNSIGPVD